VTGVGSQDHTDCATPDHPRTVEPLAMSTANLLPGESAEVVIGGNIARRVGAT
jgi:hypothetical protein